MNDELKGSLPTIAVLMATYNGEKYLPEQIDSILAQTYSDWHLYVHDDGSNDRTIDILKKYAAEFPDKISMLDYPSQGGACRNFLSMLERLDAPYYMFADQDDVWLKEKMSISFEAMLKAEAACLGETSPVCVNSDLIVTDAHLNEIAPSFFCYQNILPEYLTTFNELGTSNLATGCTMLLNRQAKEAAMQIPYNAATMHDAWIALSVLKNGGKIVTIRKPLMLYRQHEGNCLGAQDARRLTIGHRLRNLKTIALLNWKQYKMLRALRYGSLAKYIYYKAKYAVRVYRHTHRKTS